jgi:hypothetical protein
MVFALASVFIFGGCSSSDEPSNGNGNASMNDAGADGEMAEGADLDIESISVMGASSMRPGEGQVAAVQMTIDVTNEGGEEAAEVTCSYEIVPQEQTPWSQTDITGDFNFGPIAIDAGASEELTTMRSLTAEEAEFQQDFAAIAVATCTSPDESDATTDDNEIESDEFTMRFN